MANKNQMRIRRTLHKEGSVNEQTPSDGYHNNPHGSFIGRVFTQVKYVHKKKAKPFPRVGEPMSLIAQIKMFQGPCCLLTD